MRAVIEGAEAPATDELRRLRKTVAGLSAENERLSARFVAEEQRASELMKLLLVLRQLHETPTRDALLDALQDVVANVLGSEHMAIYVANGSASALTVARSAGLQPGQLADLAVPGTAGDEADAGAARIAVAAGGAALACTPLSFGGALHGAIVIHGLLEHRAELEGFDHELLELLATHAGAALAFRTS